MIVLKQFTKDPGADLDYVIDWSRWLQGSEAIVSCTWTIDPSTGTTPLTQHDALIVAGNKTSVFLKDGDANATYTVTAKVTTNNSPARKDERSIAILVAQR